MEPGLTNFPCCCVRPYTLYSSMLYVIGVFRNSNFIVINIKYYSNVGKKFSFWIFRFEMGSKKSGCIALYPAKCYTAAHIKWQNNIVHIIIIIIHISF